MAFQLNLTPIINGAAIGSAAGAALNMAMNGMSVNSVIAPAIGSMAGTFAGFYVGGFQGTLNQLTLNMAAGSGLGAYLITRDTRVSLAFAAATGAYFYYKFSTPISNTPTGTVSV